jgi:hypothetical protein
MTYNSNVNHPLTISPWNENGFKQNIHELQHIFIETNINIALNSETHFTTYT